MLTIQIEKRDVGTSLDEIRKGGKIPAVLYGKKEASQPITLGATEFMKVWKEAGESSVVILSGVGENKEALIHEVDVEPVKGLVRHADFYVIEKGKKVTVSVPIEFVGTAPAEKLGAALVKVLHEIEVEAFPKDLPHEITVDVSGLVELEQQILVSDIKVPSGVEVLTSPDEVVAIAAETKEEVESDTPADLSSIELSEERGKKEEEGEEAAE
jgi:large subunit ribosomal protein L25